MAGSMIAAVVSVAPGQPAHFPARWRAMLVSSIETTKSSPPSAWTRGAMMSEHVLRSFSLETLTTERVSQHAA